MGKKVPQLGRNSGDEKGLFQLEGLMTHTEENEWQVPLSQSHKHEDRKSKMNPIVLNLGWRYQPLSGLLVATYTEKSTC